MTSTELLNLQIEYETSDITIKELCDKYNVTTKKLKGYTKWKKRTDTQETTDIEVITDTQEITDIEVITDTSEITNMPTNPLQTETTVDINSKLQQDINSFKEKAVAYALDSITDPQYLEIKEFKDLVTIVDTVEKSTKTNEPEAPTINILVQNFMENLRDDC